VTGSNRKGFEFSRAIVSHVTLFIASLSLPRVNCALVHIPCMYTLYVYLVYVPCMCTLYMYLVCVPCMCTLYMYLVHIPCMCTLYVYLVRKPAQHLMHLDNKL